SDIVDAAEASKPLEVPRGRRLEETLPLVPQCLREPVHLAVREGACGVEAEDLLVAASAAAGFARCSCRGALLAGQRENAERGPADGNAHSSKHVLAAVVVEHRVGSSVAGAVDLE